MKTLNSVHLEGFVESCRVVGGITGKTVAKLSVVTLHPKAPVSGSLEEMEFSDYEKIHHNVRVIATGKDADIIKGLERTLKLEVATSDINLRTLQPCKVDGILASSGSDNFVDVRGGGFSLAETVPTAGNNVAKVVGKVLTTSFSDKSAKMSVSTREGDVSVFFLREFNVSAWEQISDGKIAKGDFVSMSGPVLSGEFTDGKKFVRSAMVSPHVFEKLNLKKDLNQGPSL